MAKYNFLVVDDSAAMRQLLSISLKRLPDVRVVEAGNGVEALKKLSEEKFSLVLVDIHMPLMDGLKLLDTVRQDPNISQIPIIVISTGGSESDRKRGMELGANAYLSKPIRTNELLKKIMEILKTEE